MNLLKVNHQAMTLLIANFLALEMHYYTNVFSDFIQNTYVIVI